MTQRHHHSANGPHGKAFCKWRKMTQKGCCLYQICQPWKLHEAESCSGQDHLIWPYCLLQMTVQHWSSFHGLQPKCTQRPIKTNQYPKSYGNHQKSTRSVNLMAPATHFSWFIGKHHHFSMLKSVIHWQHPHFSCLIPNVFLVKFHTFSWWNPWSKSSFFMVKSTFQRDCQPVAMACHGPSFPKLPFTWKR